MTDSERVEAIKKEIFNIPDVPANDADFNKFLEVTLGVMKVMKMPSELTEILQDTASTGWKFGAMYGAKTALSIMLKMMQDKMAEELARGDK